MTDRRPPAPGAEARAAIHQAAIVVALAVLVDREWPTSVRVGADGGLAMSYAEDRKRLDRATFEAEVVARHAGFAAERLLLGGAWVAGAYDIGRIHSLYAASRRAADRDLDLPLVQVLLGQIHRLPRVAIAHPVPPFRQRAEDLVRDHRPAIEDLAMQLFAEGSLAGSDLWAALSTALDGGG